jgi:EAL domain-containing protein (putative c-di-GMP-specific phosphodiesterase class I)
MFIPMLEAEDRMAELTLFVLRRCLLDCKQWQADGLTLHLAINISAGLLGDSQFIDTAIAQVEASRVPPQQLTFEVTESAALSDPEMARIALHRLVNAGLTISIDDYGTGQSTLSYLRQFPAKEVKIDQCFVRTMRENPADRILVRSSIELAHALGFKVVAEGVEDRDSLELLRQFDCDVVQGWLIGRPMAAADFVACVRGWRGFVDEALHQQPVAA